MRRKPVGSALLRQVERRTQGLAGVTSRAASAQEPAEVRERDRMLQTQRRGGQVLDGPAQQVCVVGDDALDSKRLADRAGRYPAVGYLHRMGRRRRRGFGLAGRALEPEGDDVKSYAETGAIATFTVTGATTRAKLPSAQASMTAREYTFSSRRLRAGRVRVAFRNAGRQPHHIIAFPYRKGATLAEAKAFFADDGTPSGPPPVDFARATRTPAFEARQAQIVELDLKRGRYALMCFLSDRAGGPPHLAKGMIAEAVVR